MSTIDRVLQLAKEKGISQAFICGKLGLRRTYLSDVRLGKDSLPNDRLAIIADILDTTPEYLKGETDVKEKTPAEADVTFDDFTYAMYGESRELTEDDKNMLLDMARMLKKRQQEGK